MLGMARQASMKTKLEIGIATAATWADTPRSRLSASVPVPAGSWPISPVDLVFLVLLPALAAFAFTRLFLVMSQTARGTLNIYSAISSPLAWAFWLGIGIGMLGHGVHLAGHLVSRALPEIFIQGEFAAKVEFLDTTLGYLLLGAGFFLVSLALLLIGQGAGPRITGPERLLFVLGSLATYGVVFIYVGVGGGQVIAAIAGSVVLSAVSLWKLPPSEITGDPIGALIVPGSFLAAVALIIWTIIIGGQPVWP